jgi:hypothetical protein
MVLEPFNHNCQSEVQDEVHQPVVYLLGHMFLAAFSNLPPSLGHPHLNINRTAKGGRCELALLTCITGHSPLNSSFTDIRILCMASSWLSHPPERYSTRSLGRRRVMATVVRARGLSGEDADYSL